MSSHEISTGFSSFSVDFEHKGCDEYRVLINGVEAFHIYDGKPNGDIQQEIVEKF